MEIVSELNYPKNFLSYIVLYFFTDCTNEISTNCGRN